MENEGPLVQRFRFINLLIADTNSKSLVFAFAHSTQRRDLFASTFFIKTNNMRQESDSVRRPSIGRPISPPASDIWTTERRLAEKAPPGAPSRKRYGRRSSMPFPASEELDEEYSTTKRQHLIQHSNRIDTEEEVSSSYSSESTESSYLRPSRLVFDTAEQVTEQEDPTTVLLVPQAAAHWASEVYETYEEEEEEDEEDLILSPRLFGPSGRFEPVEDRNDDIFRSSQHGAEAEGREGHCSRGFSWSPSLRHDETESRM